MNAPVSLKALAESKADGIQKATTFKVHPNVVEFETGFNLRDEGPELDAHIDQLEVAMRAGAYIPAIDLSVVDGRMIVRDGHCRTRAARRIEGYLLEARQLRGNEADAVFHMLGSDQRKSFSPVEVARGYLRLVNMGQDVAAIAARLGLHRSTIENALTLAEAPVAVQSMVAAGDVSASLAVKTVRKEGTKATAKLAEAVQVAKAAGKAKATAKHVEPKARADKGTKVAAFEPGSSPELNAIHEVIMNLGGEWPEVESDPYTLAHVKELARKVKTMWPLCIKLADMNPIATPRREEIAELIAEANRLLGRV